MAMKIVNKKWKRKEKAVDRFFFSFCRAIHYDQLNNSKKPTTTTTKSIKTKHMNARFNCVR